MNGDYELAAVLGRGGQGAAYLGRAADGSYVQGTSLEELVLRAGPLDENGLHRLALATAGALAELHRAGVVHGDLRPSNVLVATGGARVAGYDVRTDLPPGWYGTPDYLAPEQVAGYAPGYASDVFSWAATMTWAATGQHPFGGADAQEMAYRVGNLPADLSRVPFGVRVVLDRCLAKQPQHRPTAQDVSGMLAGGRPGFVPHQGGPSPTLRMPVPETQSAPRKSSAGLVVALVLGLLVLVGGGAFAAVTLTGGKDPAPLTHVPVTAEPSTAAAEPTSTPASSTTPSPAPETSGISVAGTWTGTYMCNQGKTALELTITDAGSGELEATFAFKADPSNPDVPSGSFAMRGRLTGPVLELTGDRWIDQPGEYLMVDLKAAIEGDKPTAIRGIVDSDGCSTFEVRRR
ncbi:MAG: protein kinase [Nonomuraea sp.]|nr:protein kinase [Nonomuraea sp.]